MRLRWTIAAADDLDDIAGYLQANLPHFSRSTIHRIDAAIRSLRSMPERGRPGRVEGTRELLIPGLPYLAVYRVKDEAIEILRIVHGARNRT